MARTARTRVIYSVSACAALGLAYGAGAWQGHVKLEEQKTQSERALEDAQRETSKLGAELAAERVRTGQLEARRRLHVALAALEQRNFGIAQSELGRAAALLEKAHPEPGSELSKLQAGIAGYKIIASEDIGKERDMIQGWVKRFDALVPSGEP